MRHFLPDRFSIAFTDNSRLQLQKPFPSPLLSASCGIASATLTEPFITTEECKYANMSIHKNIHTGTQLRGGSS